MTDLLFVRLTMASKRKSPEDCDGLAPAVIRHHLHHNQNLLDRIADYYEAEYRRVTPARIRFNDVLHKRQKTLSRMFENVWATIEALIESNLAHTFDTVPEFELDMPTFKTIAAEHGFSAMCETALSRFATWVEIEQRVDVTYDGTTMFFEWEEDQT